ncbi:MAG: type II/IV secretion system ATPase subunit [Halobacteriales archaeon]|nr:type II/IV secretion system ATPase subunit [Halobacteriales archaeon]
MDKRIPRSEFASALEASGAKLKPGVAQDPAKALGKVQGKARDKLLARLGIPGGMKLTASVEGDDVLLHAEGEDRFAADQPEGKPKTGLLGKKARPEAAPAAGEAPPAKTKGLFRRAKKDAQAGDETPKPAEHPVAVVPMAPDGKGPAWKPPLKASEREVDIYPVNMPFAWVRIVKDVEQHETVYNVLEPPLSEREQRILAFLEDTLVDVIEIPLSALNDKQAQAVLLEHVNQIMYDYSILLEEQSKAKLLYFVERDFLGFGLIDAMMKDDQIEDISCDGPHVPLFMYHRQHESLKSNVQFMTDEALDGFVISLAQRSGKHISIAEPLLDATLPDGSRLNSSLSDEVTSCGSTFTVRKFKQVPFTPPDLVRFGTMSADLLAYWWLAVQYGASSIYAGGTASGKTTSLNAILLFIPPTMKIVSIEDTREINLPHPNWIPGITRSGFGPRDDKGRQAGEIDMFTLLKAALRQRPEYILVGEVRGQEAFTLFQAMATGHTAYGTMHADSVEAVIHRLEGEPINIPRTLLESLDVVSVQIQTRINGKRVRRTKELVEIVGLDPHTKEILTNTVFLWNPATDLFEYSGVSYVLERIQAERNWTPEQMRTEWDNRKEIIRWLIDRDVRDFRAVAKVITAYYKEPDALLKFIRSTVLDPTQAGPGAQPPLLVGDLIAGIGKAGASPAPSPPPAAQAPALPPALESALQPHEAEVEAMVQQFEAAAEQALAEARPPPNEDVRPPRKPGGSA